jgi:hypothetical protein
MGPGEDYWHKWSAWFFGLSKAEKVDYRSKWPEPETWTGFFDYFEASYEVPPTREQQWAQIDAAGGPIRADEIEITDPARIIWLTLNGLIADASGDGMLRWVDGSKWHKSYEGATYKPRLIRQVG